MKVLLVNENSENQQKTIHILEELRYSFNLFENLITLVNYTQLLPVNSYVIFLPAVLHKNVSITFIQNPDLYNRLIYLLDNASETVVDEILEQQFCAYIVDSTNKKQIITALKIAKHATQSLLEERQTSADLATPENNNNAEQVNGIANKPFALETHSDIHSFLQKIFDYSDIQITIIDRNYYIVYQLNQSNLLFPTSDNLLGQNIFDYLPLPAIEPLMNSLSEVKSSNARNYVEVKIELNSNTSFNIKIFGLLSADNKTEYFAILATNSSAGSNSEYEKQHELIKTNKKLTTYIEQVEENSKIMQNTLDNMLEGCHILNFDRKYKFINQAAAQQCKLNPSEIIGQSFENIWPVNLNQIIHKKIEQVLYQRIPAHFETSYVMSNGIIGWFDMSMQPIPEGIFIRTLDLKEKKKAESELKQKKDEYLKLSEAYKEQNLNLLEMNKVLEQKEEKLRFLYDNMIQGVIYLNAQGQILDANFAAQEMLGNSIKNLKRNDFSLENIIFIDEAGNKYPPDKIPILLAIKDATSINNLIIGIYSAFSNSYKWLNISFIPILNQVANEYGGGILTLQDITEQRIQAKKIEISEKKFRALFDTIQLGIVFVDRNGTLIENNKATETILGGKFNYLISKIEKKHDATSDSNKLHKTIDFSSFPAKKAVQNGTPILDSIIEGINPLTNQFTSITVSAFPITDPLTQEPMAYAVLEDKTKQRLFDLENLKLRTAFEQSSSAFLLIDTDGKIEDVNIRFELDTGYLRNEVIGHTPIRLASQINNEDFFLNLRDEINKGKSWIGEIHVKRKNGSFYWANTIISPVRDSYGTITHFFITVQDITQQKKDSEELEEYRAHLENLVNERTVEISEITHKLMNLIENMPLGYIETDREGEINSVNQAAVNIFLTEREDLGGKPLWFLTNNKDYMFQKLKNSQDMVKTFTRRHVIGNLSKILRWNIIKLFDDNQQISGTASIIEDITALKDAEIQLKQALTKERELNEMKSNFVSMTSHQFRTPLTTILSNTEMLELLFSKLETNDRATAKRFTQRIIDNIERLDLLMSDVLLIGKNQSGKIIFRPQFIHLTDFLQNLVADTKFLYKDERKVELFIQGTEKSIEADPHLLSHIMTNLISNAFKYSNTNPRIEVDFEENHVQLVVADDGIGIPYDEQDKIFTTFFRASNTENIVGTGLGMVIVKDYVLKHHGNIHFTSAPGNGTRFIVKLPYKQPEYEENINN